MKKWPAVLLTALMLAAGFFRPAAARAETKSFLPYRILVVADRDLARHDPAGRIQNGDTLVADVIALLKLWAMPFEVFDSSAGDLDPSLLLDAAKRPRYGAIIWCAARSRLGRGLKDAEIAATREAVRAGTGLIDPAGLLADLPELGPLVAIVPAANASADDHSDKAEAPAIAIRASHFLTDGTTPEDFAGIGFPSPRRPSSLPEHRLLTAAGQTVLAARENPGGKGVLLQPPDAASYQRLPVFARLLRRSVLWTIGYGLYRLYPATVLLRLDDPGAANPAYLEPWSFASLNADEWRRAIVEPAMRRRAKVDVFAVPGFPVEDDGGIVIKKSWEIAPFTDRFGLYQDYPALWRAMRDSARQGGLAIHSHGWTHMQPDLASWREAPDRFTNSAWFKEFYDRPRNRPAPAEIQRQHLERSRQWLAGYFGAPPIVFAPPGDAVSAAAAGQPSTYQLAGEADFGLALDRNGTVCLDGGITVAMKMIHAIPLERTPDMRETEFPVVLRWHDRDHRLRGLDFLERRLAELEKQIKSPGYLGAEELCAGLHTRIDAPGGEAISFTLRPHELFGRAFINAPSQWCLTLTDETLRDTEGPVLSINGAAIPVLRLLDRHTAQIELPPLDPDGSVVTAGAGPGK